MCVCVCVHLRIALWVSEYFFFFVSWLVQCFWKKQGSVSSPSCLCYSRARNSGHQRPPHRQHVRPSPWQRHLGWQNCWARSRVQAHRVGESRGMAVSPVLLPFFRLLSTLVLGSRHCNLLKWCTVDLIACCYRCLLVLAYSVWGLGAQARWQEGEFYLYLFATAVEWNTGLDFRARYHIGKASVTVA